MTRDSATANRARYVCRWRVTPQNTSSSVSTMPSVRWSIRERMPGILRVAITLPSIGVRSTSSDLGGLPWQPSRPLVTAPGSPVRPDLLVCHRYAILEADTGGPSEIV